MTLTYRLEGLVLKMVLGFFRLLGVARASNFGGWLLRSIGPRISPSRRARRNLETVMPELSDSEREAIIAAMWENLGRTLGEYAHLEAYAKSAAAEDGGLITLEGLENAEQAVAKGQGVIFFSGHFANWEVLPLCLSRWKDRVGEVYRAANNPAANQMILDMRSAHIAPQQFPKGSEGARGMVRHLKQGGLIAMLTDQKLREGLTVPFMGHDAQTPPSAAQLGLKFGAPLMPVTIQRRAGHCFTITVHPALPDPAAEDRPAAMLEQTTAMNDFLSNEIRRAPGQWLWLHNRWGFPKNRA